MWSGPDKGRRVYKLTVSAFSAYSLRGQSNSNMALDPRALGGKSGHNFANWAKTYTCQPEAYFEPKTTDEMREILSCAQQRGKKVKVVGCGHSPSDLACTTDYMICLRHYNRLLKVDKERSQVKVEGGMLVRDLNDSVLNPNGLALSVLGSISDISIAGTISTGTHGTGERYGTLSSYIVELELLTASGEILEISADKNPELLPAVRCSLGCLGIILNVTIQCEPAFRLHQKTYPSKLNDILENLQVHVSASDHFRFLWFPHTEDVVVSHVNRTSKDICNKSSWFWDYGIGYYLLEFCLWISTFFPRIVPTINRLFFKHLHSQVREKVDRSDVIFNFECLFKQYVMEWAIPRPYGKLVPTDKYWDAFENIVNKVGGRPHWAKDHKVGPQRFTQLYPHWNTFCQIRKRLDPNGMFLNNYLERVFGTA
ncbi:L-gulonolactone oxidase-like isoform X2 [Liolophura sinensis]|uniref:L-gulonolactone oxidase-like isoform X2 n=1 Tax=Liolophura sinensis TaxID=3198878 RepID=UPI00315822D1